MPAKPEKRLQREFERLQKFGCPFPIMDVIQIDNNIFHWKVMMNASDRSPFAGGNYWINIEFPRNYPIRPPIVKFITQLYHPNISENGQIDARILKEDWSPIRTINTVLLTIAAILNQPMDININNYVKSMKYGGSLCHGFGFNKDCVILYTHNRLLYEEVANDSAVTNAGATRQYNLMDILLAIRELLFMGLGENSAFDIEAVLISYTGLNIKKLNKWCRELKLDRDNRYKRFLMNKPKVFDRKLIAIDIGGRNCTLWNDSTMKDLKRQIHVTSPMIFNGEILCDNDIIAHRGIINGSCVDVVPPYQASHVCDQFMRSGRNLFDGYTSNDEGVSHEQSMSYSGVHLPGSYNRSLRHNPMK